MTEHENLKEIIDLIGYENNNFRFIKEWQTWPTLLYKNFWVQNQWDRADVREIIFTDWFIKCIYDYCDNTPWTWIMECDVRLMESKIMQNLHDPVSYLYYLIKQ